MVLRLLKIILPVENASAAEAVLREHEEIEYWQEEATEAQFVVSILTSPEESEALMDLFERRFAAIKGFRMVLLPVEAAVPRPEKEQKAPPEEPAEKEQAAKKMPLRVSREELYADVSASSELTAVYLVLVLLSTIVAAIGLMRGNVAVVIGAMVVAPLLGPNVALALGTTLADEKLGRNAMRVLAAGIGATAAFSLLVGALFEVDPEIQEIASRTQVGLSDIILALAAGSAGVLAFTSGISTALIGVMVAVALLPPLVVGGLLVGAGYLRMGAQALLLFGTNVICVNLAGVLTFLLQGVRPRTWWEVNRARKASLRAIWIWTVLLILLAALVLLARFRAGLTL